MMRWGRKKPVSSSSSSSSSSSGLSRAFPVSWFSKLGGSSDLKPAKEKKQDDEATCGFLEVDAMDRNKGTVVMTPRIHFNIDKQRRERRDQRLLQQKPKRSEQDLEVKTKKPARRTGTESYSKEDSVILGHTATESAHQWQKLKEVKLREVKLKADQHRKSLYLKRELNNKVRVFSPRASEKCRVKAIEDLKKAKVRAREHEHVIETADGGMENDSFALVKCSSDPQKDFRDSMIEMIMENGINHPEQLKELLVCYLRLNNNEYHEMIINVFQQVHNDMNFH